MLSLSAEEVLNKASYLSFDLICNAQRRVSARPSMRPVPLARQIPPQLKPTMPQPSRRGPTQNQEAQRAEPGRPSGLGTYRSYPPTEAHPLRRPPLTPPLSLSRQAQSEDPPKQASSRPPRGRRWCGLEAAQCSSCPAPHAEPVASHAARRSAPAMLVGRGHAPMVSFPPPPPASSCQPQLSPRPPPAGASCSCRPRRSSPIRSRMRHLGVIVAFFTQPRTCP
jgi:hypothetical protein